MQWLVKCCWWFDNAVPWSTRWRELNGIQSLISSDLHSLILYFTLNKIYWIYNLGPGSSVAQRRLLITIQNSAFVERSNDPLKTFLIPTLLHQWFLSNWKCCKELWHWTCNVFRNTWRRPASPDVAFQWQFNCGLNSVESLS